MTTPEARARQNIDALLTAAGWIIQDRAALNLFAGRGVAVREFPLNSGYADYLLFVDRKAVGVIEAKAEGQPLSAVADQAARYSAGLPGAVPHVRLPLPFLYESTGVETYFRDERDPHPRSRPVFAFHRPETLAAWLAEPDTLRTRLRRLPDEHPLTSTALWPAQREAITHLEASLAADRPRALIQMATGSGKTFTAVNFTYRLIKFAGARRVLFLVDRNNLGRQAYAAFDRFLTPDDGRKFTELYNVQHLQSNLLDGVSKVHITTIQRLFSMLSGEPEFDPAFEEASLFDSSPLLNQNQVTARYNPAIPPEYYDFIITDECHRSIYNLWQQVLLYFDAHLIGLTATPGKQAFGFFDNNLVMEYNRARAVADGVNVDGEVYRIRTRITEQGETIEKGWCVRKRDRRTRREKLELLDEDFTYDPQDLDRQVTTLDQIRTVLRAYRDSLPELFPGRAEVPKTLIFAKDDHHAEEIVRIARQVFDHGDAFCQKITYRSGEAPEALVSAFRTAYLPRIAVTVDMIATGTDIRPLEALIFMRAVRSRLLFEQMLGRGTRVIPDPDFQAVTITPGARKTRFVIVDAVGVTDQELSESVSVERRRSASLKSLLDAAALGALDEDGLASLARRLALVAGQLSPAQQAQAADFLSDSGRAELPGDAPVGSLSALANALIDAQDPDAIEEFARRQAAPGAEPDLGAAARCLAERAQAPLAASPGLRAFLLEREIVIDEVSLDAVLEQGFDGDASQRARALVDSFQGFLETHKDEIAALQVLYHRPYAARRLDYAALKTLAEQLDRALKAADPLFLTEELWQAYARLEKDRVRGVGQRRMLTDLVALVRHAARPEGDLEPYADQVARRYADWLAAAEARGQRFSPAQRWWLEQMARAIGINLGLEADDLDQGAFADRGGRVAARHLFGAGLPALLDELNTALVDWEPEA